MKKRIKREIYFRKQLTETHKTNLEDFLLYSFIDNELKRKQRKINRLTYKQEAVLT